MSINKGVINYNYLRPLKAKALKKWNEKELILNKDLKTYSYKNATILPLKKLNNDNLLFGRGGVVTENCEYVNESAIEGRVQFSYDFEYTTFCDRKVVYCGYIVKHWGHFLVESVSRMWYFFNNDETVDSYVFFTDVDSNFELKGNYREFFDLLGITDKIEIINKPIRYREVIVPELGYKWRDSYSNEYKNIFATISSNIKNNNYTVYDKIFFTRSRLSKAFETDIGMEITDDYFSKNGFKIISPEKISLSELIFYIKNSKVCASVSGTLPHNMLFGNDNQNLIIVERNVLNNEIQLDIDNIKELNVTYIDANLALYPINLGYGPYIYSSVGMLELFSKDNEYLLPDCKYSKRNYIRKCVNRYMRIYNKAYKYQWFMESWMINYTDYMYEAYSDSMSYIGDYIVGTQPYEFIQNFKLHYIKQRIKRLLHFFKIK